METKQALIFIIPPFLFLGIPFFCLGYTILLSFTNATMAGGIHAANFVGLENYLRLMSSPVFQTALRNNFFFLFVLVSMPLIIGLLVAILLSFKVKGQTFFKAAFYFPLIVSFVVSGTIWTWIFRTSGGLVNTTLNTVGLDYLTISWLSDSTFVFIPLALAGIWHVIGYPIILFSAGILDIPNSVMDAAKMDASTTQTYRHIVIPLLKPLILSVATLLMIMAFKIFDIVFVITYGGPVFSTYVLAFMVYMDAISAGSLGYGSAIATILMLVSLVSIATVLYLTGRKRNLGLRLTGRAWRGFLNRRRQK